MGKLSVMVDGSLSRERLQRFRVDLLNDMRTRTTAADVRGGRLLVARVLQIVRPDAPLGQKLAACGRRNPRNDSRQFCEHAACPVCMRRRGIWLFVDRLWPSLEAVPPSRLRWVTVLMFRHADLDDGAREMNRQHRRLQHVLKKYAGRIGSDRRRTAVRVWGAREVERDGTDWLFHVHMLIDLAGADPNDLAEMLREAFGRGERQVQLKSMRSRSHRLNIFRMSQYMSKTRYTSGEGGRQTWLTNDDIVALAMWRDRLPSQWHRFTWGVRGL